MAASLCLLSLFLNAFSAKFDYQLIESYTRNIIFIGNSDLLIEILKDKKYESGVASTQLSFQSFTTELSFQSFTMKSKTKHNIMHVNTINIPEFSSYKLNIIKQRKYILHVIKKCIDMEVTNINHIYFVISIVQGLTKQGIESFLLYANSLLGMKDKISIIISFAHHLTTQNKYDHYINQFKYIPDLQPLYQTTNGRIFFLGTAQVTAMYNKTKLQQNVHLQRTKLLEHITQQHEYFNLKQLNIYQTYLSLIKQLRNTLIECCTNTGTCIDMTKFDFFINDFVEVNNKKAETIIENKYQNKSTLNVRNIVFIGKFQRAITAPISVLKNEEYNTALFGMRVMSDNNNMIYRFDMHKLHINIMDSSLFFQQMLQIQDAANMSTIIFNLINQCIDSNFTQINHVYLVITLENGLTEKELQVFHVFTDLFVGMEGKISIIISTQNACTKRQYNHSINQLKSNQLLQSMYQTIHGQIFFLCVIQKGEMYIHKGNVLKQRQQLVQHIAKQTQSYSVKSLNIHMKSVLQL
eukprot:321440_1